MVSKWWLATATVLLVWCVGLGLVGCNAALKSQDQLFQLDYSMQQRNRNVQTKIKELRALNEDLQTQILLLQTQNQQLQSQLEQYQTASWDPKAEFEKSLERLVPIQYSWARTQYADSLWEWSNHYGLSPHLMAALLWRESKFNPKLVSSAGARGPMQIMWRYHKTRFFDLGKTSLQDAHDIDTNVRIGCQIFREYWDKSGGNIFRALSMYLGGGSNADPYAKDILRKYVEIKISPTTPGD